jgi:LPS export ABC transporter protein LptC
MRQFSLSKNLVQSTCSLLLVLFSFACENDLKNNEKIVLGENFPESVYYNFKINYSDSGYATSQITGDTLKQYEAKDFKPAHDLMTGNVHLILYRADGSVKSQMKADKAIRYREEGDLHAFNNIVVFNEIGEKLNTEQIIWYEKTGKIKAPVPVKITKKDQILYGDSMISDQYFLNYTLSNPRGEFIINGQE